jgi:hypothetical protein
MQIMGNDGDYFIIECQCEKQLNNTELPEVKYIGKNGGTPAIRIHCPRCNQTKDCKLSSLLQGWKGLPYEPAD